MTPCDLLGMELSALVDGECNAEDERRVREHLLVCAECTERAELWRSFGDRMRRGDETPKVNIKIRDAVHAELAKNAAPARSGLLQFPRSVRVGATAAAAVILFGTFVMFSSASAEDDLRQILKLESDNRAAAYSQQTQIDSLRLEISALRQRSRAARLKSDDLTTFDAETQSLFYKADELERRLASLQARMESESLLLAPGPKAASRPPK
ncbi:MAG: anti-sigma factor family protein [Planctomycetota bacterium]